MVDKISKEYKLFMPVSKSSNGSLVGILSDTSMDRDEEFMSKELIEGWSKKSNIKALVNHDNKMQSWVGGWKELKTISKGNHTALVAEPWFFSKEANPLAENVRLQVEESLSKGEQPGISISAIMTDFAEEKIEGKNYKKFTKGELLEATWVPIQSNRNATFGHIAKQFDFSVNKEEVTKPKKVDDCVKALMDDPNFKPQEGKTKEESAWAVCTARFKECDSKIETKVLEDNNMEDEIKEVPEEKEVEVKEKEVLEEKEVPEEKEVEIDINKMLEEKFNGLNERLSEIEKKLENRKVEMKSIEEDMEAEIEKKEVEVKEVKPTVANIIKSMIKEE